MPSDELVAVIRERLDDEEDNRIASVAAETFRSWGRLHCLNQVLEEIKQASQQGVRWVLLDSLLEVGDPGDAGVPMPSWAAAASQYMTWYMRDYFYNELKKRQKKLKKDLKWKDRNSE